MATITTEREVSTDELRHYAQFLDPCTVCDHVCSHPGCWEASRRYVRQLLRLVQNGEYDPEAIYQAQKMQQDEFEKQRRVKAVAKLNQKMPTQKIVNLNRSFPDKEKTGASKSAERELTRVSMELFDLAGKPSDSTGTKESEGEEDTELEDAKSVSSNVSREILRSMENNKDQPPSDKLSSIFTPPVAASPKPRTPLETSLPTLPSTPQIFPTSKVDPLSNLKVRRKPDTVLVWVGPKRAQEPKYREQVFVMTREGKAAVPNKNFTDEILPASFEATSKLNVGGGFNRELSKSEFTHRSKQNTTRIIPVQEEVINELLSLPKEILSQVLEQVTAVDLLTPAKTNEVIEAILSQLHNARVLEMSKIADECVISRPVPIYNGEAKKYHEHMHHVQSDPQVGLKLSHTSLGVVEKPGKVQSLTRVPDWIREQSLISSYPFKSDPKLSRVSFNQLPPLRSDLGGLFNRSKSIRKHYPALESPVQRGLIPIPSPLRSKNVSRANSAQSKLSQISAALATLPSSPYSHYRSTLDKKAMGSSEESRSSQRRDEYVFSEDPKTPDTQASTASVWPLNEEMKNYEELRSTAGLKTPETLKEEHSAKSPKKFYPSVPPPSPDTNIRLNNSQKTGSTLDHEDQKQASSAENAFEGSPDNAVINAPNPCLVEPQGPKFDGHVDDKYNHELPKTESFKHMLTPAATTLTTISEASVDSISEPQTARDRIEAEQSVESMTNVDSGNSLANKNATNATKSQYSLQSDSNESFLNRIESEASKDVQSSEFSPFPSVSKISLAEIPYIEKEPEPLNLEQSMKKGKVMSARKTVRFDGETEQQSSEDVPDSVMKK